ncbi:MAG: glycosyltransferase [Opitutaceae bacterium]
MLLSIVTITKDDSAGLKRTLLSTRRLREAGAEQIVVDGSADPSLARTAVEQADAAGVTLLHQPPAGISLAFNTGLAVARGRWVWFLNGGDAVHATLEPGWLLTLLEATTSEVVVGALQFDGESSPRSQPALPYLWPLVACWIGHPAALIRRDRVLARGAFKTRWKIAMDYDFWFRALDRRVPVDIVSVPFAHFDVTGVSENHRTRGFARREAAAVVLRHSFSLLCESAWIFLRVVKRLVVALGQWIRLSIGKSS